MDRLMKVFGTTTKNTEKENILLKMESIMMVIGLNPKDKDTANNIVIRKIDIRAIGKTIKNKEREFNMKEETSTRDNSRMA